MRNVLELGNNTSNKKETQLSFLSCNLNIDAVGERGLRIINKLEKKSKLGNVTCKRNVGKRQKIQL